MSLSPRHDYWSAVVAQFHHSGLEFQTPIRQRNAPMLGAPVLGPARSSKVLLAKKVQTQSSGHPFGDGWVSGTPLSASV